MPRKPIANRAGLAGALLWVPLAALLVAVLLSDRQQRVGLVGDEATYLMAAESLAWDGDLFYTRADHDRFVAHNGRRPDGLILQSGDAGERLAYAKPLFYPLLTAPFVRFAPVRGALIANVLWLALAAFLATRTLAPSHGRSAPVWIALAIFGSVLFAYAFWAHADLILAGAVAMALALVARPREHGSWRADLPALAAGALLAVVVVSRPLGSWPRAGVPRFPPRSRTLLGPD